MMLFGEMIDKSAIPGNLLAFGMFYESVGIVLSSKELIKLVDLLWISFLSKRDPIPGNFWLVDGAYFLKQVDPLMFPLCASMLMKTSVVIGPVCGFKRDRGPLDSDYCIGLLIFLSS